MGCGHVALIVALAACGDEPGKVDAPEVNFDRNALLANLGDNVLYPMQQSFMTSSRSFLTVLGNYCEALDTGPQPAPVLALVRQSFETNIDNWERADALLVGPAAMDHRTLRDRIYSWPLVSPCELDRAVVSRWANPAGYTVDAAQANARSLAAIEYLLYPLTDVHSCATEPVGWTALGSDLPRARCRLAQAIAADVTLHAEVLHEAWRPGGGGYLGELAGAGTASSSIATAHEGVNRVSDAVFYVDKMVKDMKVAEAAGIAVNACETVQTPCIREVELRYADRATFALRANLATLRAAFTGDTAMTTGPGFDDFLIAVGQQQLADRMTANLTRAITAANALPDSFLAALATDYAKVTATHAALRTFTDDLKSQFLTVLALEIPDDVATDND